jgi:hypothetical protein
MDAASAQQEPAPRAVRALLAQAPLRSYDALGSADRLGKHTRHLAAGTMAAGWRWSDMPPVNLRPPIAWAAACTSNRSWSAHFHGWDGLAPLLALSDRGEDHTFLDFAVAVAIDWAQQHQAIDAGSEFAWYDMAIGQRAYRLGYVLDRVARDPRYTDETFEELLASARLHLTALADDSRFAAHSNHGLYFAAGQLALATRLSPLPEARAAAAQARERLARIITTQFTSEGVHREHSPGYHQMVLGTLEGLLAAGLAEWPELGSLIGRAQEALAWFVMPDGSLVPLGDTSPKEIGAQDHPDGSMHPALAHVVSRGQAGAPPGNTMRAFRESGYVVIRDGWPSRDDPPGEWSYLAQTFAFHSRVHKHADDMSFVWYERGRQLLADAGRYGYLGRTEVGSDLWKDGFWYAEPERVYIESTRAHNALGIDGRNLPRHGVRPYGSALKGWGRWGTLTGTWGAASYWKGVRHRRVLVLEPGRWLVVLDELRDDDPADHSVEQHFQFGADLVLREETRPGAQGCLTFDLPGSPDQLFMVPLLDESIVEPVRGQREPFLAGWVARQDHELTPAWASGCRRRGSRSLRLATLFWIGTHSPDATAAGGGGRLSWRTGSSRHVLAVSTPNGSLSVRYVIEAE